MARPRSWISCLRDGLIVVVLALLPFVVAEGVLALMGVHPVLYEEDPYVGFSSHIPLFVEETGADGKVTMVTAENKRLAFNLQRFPKDKPKDAFRVFCMGGSTTYGRPYTDKTSFCGWLRAMLPDCDASRQWELINAGGVSYASYRVTNLMEELVRYQPDLFIIYTGHNEFLENRTYGEIQKESAFVRELRVLACRTRVFAALRQVMTKKPDSGTATPKVRSDAAGRVLLPAEVETILEHSVGPEAYHRDDKLRNEILAHFRFNLGRMVDIAASVHARVLFVSPASNLRDCSPFKSERRPGLTAEDVTQFQRLYQDAKQACLDNRWDPALQDLDKAAGIDDRYADLYYLKGRALYATGRYEEAMAAFQRARDEDVCPLRALTPMIQMVSDVARERNVPLADAVALAGARAEHGIPGADLFLDHVHPTIDMNRQIALSLLKAMEDEGMVHPGSNWNEQAIQVIKGRVEDSIDSKAHGVALRNLSMVLRWAGKREEAERLAQQATELAPDDAMAHVQRGTAAEDDGRMEEALQEFQQAVALDPDCLEAHFGLGDVLTSQGQFEEAISAYREALRINGRQVAVLCNLGGALESAGRIGEAEAILRRAIELKPDDGPSRYNLGNLLRRAGRFEDAAKQYRQTLQIYPYSEDGRVYFNLGRVLVSLNRLDEALDNFRRAQHFAPNQPEVLQGLAWLLTKHPDPNRRDAARAVALAEQANALTGRQNPAILDTLADAYAGAGRFRDAVLTERQALAVMDGADQARADHLQEKLMQFEKLAAGKSRP